MGNTTEVTRDCGEDGAGEKGRPLATVNRRGPWGDGNVLRPDHINVRIPGVTLTVLQDVTTGETWTSHTA